MPKENDSYTIKLKESHLKGWGIKRNSDTRKKIEKESYIPIPKVKAEEYSILNSNQDEENIIYKVKFKNTDIEKIEVLSSGSSKAGDKYAKQFHGKGNLKALTPGYEALGVEIGDEIRITFIDEKTFEVEKV